MITRGKTKHGLCLTEQYAKQLQTNPPKRGYPLTVIDANQEKSNTKV